MQKTRNKMIVLGGLRIAGSGVVNLLDIYDTALTDTTQDLSSQAFNATASLFIPLHPAIITFELYQVEIGYVDGANTNDLANVHLFAGTSATDNIQQEKWIWSSGAVVETPGDASANMYLLNPSRTINLDTAGKLYFITTWSTAVISSGSAAEWLFIKVYGREGSSAKS